ncbi:HORMA domain-containing protein 1-like [Hydractinia symbiolongicarpus]|uniref:HORMA domain-containing protein 1-like n=1 Tax=Hydractinia symbiolongicarpus TaxID=13093 RepID=UPI00254DA24B|nr:HORMA domain-containing protein 1-like [Hydractinia symbiolongicarpus]
MSTSQQVRSQAKQGQWSSIFPNEQVTETQSTLFVKKLLAVAVSSISYLRALFPENAFGDRCLEDVNLKILRDDSTCPEACRVIQWIRGCFDALEKKYLRAVLVGIYEDPEDPDTVIEQYSFKFAYGDGGGVDIYRNGTRITNAKSDKETKKATIRLLRTIVLLSQTLNPLPDDVMMTMKLLYYDEVTPEDYNPPGFKDYNCDSFFFKDEPINIKVGDVATVNNPDNLKRSGSFKIRSKRAEKSAVNIVQINFEKFKVCKCNIEIAKITTCGDGHCAQVSRIVTIIISFLALNFLFSLKLRIKTQNHDLQEQRENEDVEENHEETEEARVPDEEVFNTANEDVESLYNPEADVDKENKENKEPEMNIHVEDVENTSLNMEDDVPKQSKQSNTRVSTPASSVIPDDEQEETVKKCPCGVNEDDGLMILCAACNTWQHATCFGIIKPEEAPETHYCVECTQNSDEYQCTDQNLAKIEDANKIRADCLWRRTLLSVLETTRILASNLSKRLGVPLAVATSLLKRLEAEGFVKPGGKAKRFGKLVQKKDIAERGFHTYFYNSHNEQTEELSIMTEKASNMQITLNKGAKGKGSKRKSGGEAVSIHNKDLRFDVSDSQNSPSSRKRRKTSVSAEPMCV